MAWTSVGPRGQGLPRVSVLEAGGFLKELARRRLRPLAHPVAVIPCPMRPGPLEPGFPWPAVPDVSSVLADEPLGIAQIGAMGLGRVGAGKSFHIYAVPEGVVGAHL